MVIKDKENMERVKRDKKYRCIYCSKTFKNPDQLYMHINSDHKDKIPDGKSVQQEYYDQTHPGDHMCQICKIRKCVWNQKTCRYSTLCDNPACREEARKRFRENFKKKNGYEHTLNNPELQKEMMKNRKTSGEYEFSTGGKISYISSYEKDFLEFCDINLHFSSSSIQECPFIFNYIYEGKPHFYIPDFYIPEYDLIIEIKADTDVTHPKILAVDKEMEALKDEAVKKDNKHNYIKICDKEYDAFLELIILIKNDYTEQRHNNQEKYIIIPERKTEVRGFDMPSLKLLWNEKDLNCLLMRKIVAECNKDMNVSLITKKINYPIESNLFDGNDKVVLKTYNVDMSDINTVKRMIREFEHYYTKQYETFINQDYLSITMEIKSDKISTMYLKNVDSKRQKSFIDNAIAICVNNEISIYGVLDTKNGCVLIIDTTTEKRKKVQDEVLRYCNINKLSKNLEIDKKEFVEVPGTVDAGQNVNIIV